MPKISVIVPVYNVETYLTECLDSLLAQTFADWEAILIDDGSTDASGRICDEYAEKDARFRVLHQKNHGVSAARNAGLDAATGEFLAWVDSDDFIETHALETLHAAAVCEGADIVSFGYASVWGDEVVVRQGGGERLTFEGKSAVFGSQFSRKVVFYLWDKFYRRTLFDGLRFPVGAIYEDAFLLPQVFARAEKLVVLPESLYFYRMRAGSITHMLDNAKLTQWIDATKPMVGLACREFPEHVLDAQARLQIIRLRCMDAIFECPHFRRHLCWKPVSREVRQQLFAVLFSRSKLLRPARRAYAACAVLFPDVAALVVKKKMKKNREFISYIR